jgi:hypothetical protein
VTVLGSEQALRTAVAHLADTFVGSWAEANPDAD